MKKKSILFVSIAAVFIMILASCSTVVSAENIEEKKEVKKIEQIVDAYKEKTEISGSVDPDVPQPACLNILGLIFFLIWFFVWLLSGCPPVAPPV